MFGAATHRQYFCTYSALAGLYALTIGLIIFTWKRLPDVVVDFGRELYVPWRLVEGDVLYQDIAYFNGPFSPYFNSAVFSIFGASVSAIVVVNSLLLMLLITIMYFQLVRLFKVRTALVGCSAFLLAFAFSHTFTIGNYNYICPYSHEMTHGVVLTFGMLALLFSNWSRSGLGQFLTGVLWGCVFLGKAEIFVAATAMLLAAEILRTLEQRSLLQLSQRFAATLAGALIVIAGFYLLLRQSMEPMIAWQGIAGTWMWVLNSEVTGQAFYDHITGMDRPFFNFVNMMISSMCVAGVMVGVGLVDSWRDAGQKMALPVALAILVCAVTLNQGFFPLLINGRPLPVVAIVLLVGLLVKRFKAHELSEILKLNMLVVWTVLGGALLLKMPLNCSVMHYGFVLAMPITIIAIAICLEWVPEKLCPMTGGKTCGVILSALIFMDLAGMVAMSTTNLAAKQHCVGSGSDSLMASSRRGGENVADAIKFLDANASSQDSVLVLPEGVMLNYMTRRKSSTRFVNLCPPEMQMYGESNVKQAILNSPADWVVLVNKDVREYGHERFGEVGYGAEILEWIRGHYAAEQVFGSEFSKPTESGVTVFRRNATLVAQ